MQEQQQDFGSQTVTYFFLGQYFSLHQNHLERLLKPKFLGITLIDFDLVGLGVGSRFCLSHKLAEKTDAACSPTIVFMALPQLEWWWTAGYFHQNFQGSSSIHTNSPNILNQNLRSLKKKIENYLLDQWLSNFSMHQKCAEVLLKHRQLGPTPRITDQVGLWKDKRFWIFKQVPR